MPIVNHHHVIAVDFDGTCVEHEYPNVGADVPHAVAVLKRLQQAGHKLIIWTMRSGPHLRDAKGWYISRGLIPYGYNENPSQKSWTESPKAYAQIYIDDAALGCPLIEFPDDPERRPYVDWKAVERDLERRGVLPPPPPPPPSNRPMCDRLAATREDRQTIGDFVEWLRTKGYFICEERKAENAEAAKTLSVPGERTRQRKSLGELFCEILEHVSDSACVYWPTHKRLPDDLLAEFFEIDQDQLENERRQALDELRARHEPDQRVKP